MNSTPLTSLEEVTSAWLLQLAEEVVSKVQSWAKGKVYTSLIDGSSVHTRTYSGDLNNDFWAGRVTEFDTDRYWLYFDEYIVGSLLDNGSSHTHYEKEYIHQLYDFKLYAHDLGPVPTGYSGATNLAKLYYTFGFPLKNRKFSELIHVLRASDGSHAFVISLAVDPLLLEKESGSFVAARYTSVEKVEKNGDKVKWTMATCSDPGGFIPTFVTKASIKGAIAKDVPSFLTWAKKKKLN